MAKEEIFTTPVGHLEEFRNRLIKCLLIIVLVLPVGWYFSQPLITWIWQKFCPPEMGSMYYTAPMEFFFLRMKISFIGALCIAMPFIVWHVNAYITPALYHKEKRLIFPLCTSSLFLFLSGAAIGLFGIFPLLMRFAVGMQTDGVKPWINVSSCVGMAAWLMLGFGICFQLPVFLLILINLGLISATGLRKLRPYIVVGIFIVAGLLTPPDIVSQLTMALPTWLLYEFSLFIGTRMEKKCSTD